MRKNKYCDKINDKYCVDKNYQNDSMVIILLKKVFI